MQARTNENLCSPELSAGSPIRYFLTRNLVLGGFQPLGTPVTDSLRWLIMLYESLRTPTALSIPRLSRRRQDAAGSQLGTVNPPFASHSIESRVSSLSARTPDRAVGAGRKLMFHHAPRILIIVGPDKARSV